MSLLNRRKGNEAAPATPASGIAAATTAAVPTIPEATPTPGPRRNFTVATVVGVAIFVAVLGAAWWSPLLFTVGLYLVCIGATWEWRDALKASGRRVSLWPIAVAIAGMGVATWYGKAEGLIVALLVGCAGVVAWRVVDDRIENTLADSLASMFTLLWIPFLASFFVLMEQAHDGWQRVYILIFAVAGNDTGALISGMFFGKHKMSPRISPNKTWEGFAGGIVLGTIAASVLAYFILDGAWITGALAGLAAALAAVLGDLAESAIKRDISVKDMSSFLPGHGGILDRIDSMLVAAPVAYVVFALLLGTS
ncbi:phosphatidate cytidylyltransferase [Demequina sp.]|uniref:phosphatidate cytidylyltransferase n=1 Tax=Demequina sp. TaxID=2050685 RepID=UPI003D0E9572